MGSVEWNNFIPQFGSGTGKVNGKNTTPEQAQNLEHAQEAKHTSSTPGITVDMSELEVKAAMNQALGFTRTSDTEAAKMAKFDNEFRQNPVAFAAKYASPEVRANAEAAGVNADYALQAFRGDNELAAKGPQAFVKEHLNGQVADVARNFSQAGITDELDKIFVA